MQKKEYFSELIQFIIDERPSKDRITRFKTRLCKKHKKKHIPTDIEVLAHAPVNQLSEVRKYLLSKPTRTLSGVAVVAIMSKPQKCPHGACIMCPSKTKKGVPQSYTGREPASMRAIRNDFDPYLQVMNRLEQYAVLGHTAEKIDLIIMGGTFMAFPKSYRDNFVAYALKAMNDFSKHFFNKQTKKFNTEKFRKFFEITGKVDSEKREKTLRKRILSLKGKAVLEDEQKRNERSFVRCIGMTIETRPDYAKEKHAREMLRLGATRVELGVQTVYDDILEKIDRGHTVEDSIAATRILKDMGFKINYHMMPGLPGSNPAKDKKAFLTIFEDSGFRPDMLKIYPCMVVKESRLYQLYRQGRFTPMTTDQAARLIAGIKPYVPEYVRITRVQRDIPTYATVAGVDRTNLRQYIERYNPLCRCIRCREVGIVAKKKVLGKIFAGIVTRKYKASQGTEYFISFEDTKQDIILGYARLRIPSGKEKGQVREITGSSALLRELHVLGESESIGARGLIQHRGYGKRLLRKSEQIARKQGKARMVVISGIGARGYYRKFGYRKQGSYMVKGL
jgi:elongator complex protein 3